MDNRATIQVSQLNNLLLCVKDNCMAANLLSSLCLCVCIKPMIGIIATS